jgi:hypothetical protein
MLSLSVHPCSHPPWPWMMIEGSKGSRLVLGCDGAELRWPLWSVDDDRAERSDRAGLRWDDAMRVELTSLVHRS